MIFLVSPSGHEHYQKELAQLVASTAGPLDAAIGELRARHDIEQLTPQVIPGRCKALARLSLTPRLPLTAHSRQVQLAGQAIDAVTERLGGLSLGQVREPPIWALCRRSSPAIDWAHNGVICARPPGRLLGASPARPALIWRA
jgi:hypothetical protein